MRFRLSAEATGDITDIFDYIIPYLNRRLYKKSKPNRPFSSRRATADHCLENAHSTRTTWGLLLVTFAIYVNVMLGVTCCSSVKRACGLFSTPERVGSMRSLLTPKSLASRPATGFAIAEPSRADAPIC